MAHSVHAMATTTEGFELGMPTLVNTRKMDKNIRATNHQDDGQPLSPVSQMFHKPDACSYILAILGFKSLVDVEHFKAQMVGFAQGHRRFHSLQLGKKDKLKWVRTEVDIHQHVIAPEIDTARITSGEKFLEDYLYNLTKTGIDMSKPMWEFHILNGVETSNDVKSVGIGRIHHSLGDGTSLMLYFLTFARSALNGTATTAASLFPKPTNNKTANVGVRKKSVKNKIKSSWNLARNTTVDVLTTVASLNVLKDTKNPLTALPDTGRACRRIVQRTVSLEDVKLVKTATNTKVNDVLMAVLEAGLSRYLNRKYGEMSCRAQKKYESGNFRLRAIVAFNLRMNHRAVSQIGSVGGKSGNQIGFIIYPLQAPVRSNPIEYVHAAKAKMDRKKNSLGAHFTNGFTNVMVKLFGTKVLHIPKTVSLYNSNMIGPLEDITWFGYPVDHMAISCYGQSVGLFVNVTSYANKLTFALSVDERIVPDPRQLCDDLEDSLILIKKAALAS